MYLVAADRHQGREWWTRVNSPPTDPTHVTSPAPRPVLPAAVLPARGHEDVVSVDHLLAQAARQVEGDRAEGLPTSWWWQNTVNHHYIIINFPVIYMYLMQLLDYHKKHNLFSHIAAPRPKFLIQEFVLKDLCNIKRVIWGWFGRRRVGRNKPISMTNYIIKMI